MADLDARRRLPLRVVLLMLAFVPSAAMVALLAVSSGQLYDTWHTATSRENSVVSGNGAVPATGLYYGLQEERALSAATLADPADYKAKLAQVRKLTDASAAVLQSLTGVAAPSVTASLQQFETQFRQLSGYRIAIDDGTASQQEAYDDYTALISSNLSLFAALTQTGIADIDIITLPSTPTGWGEEMISREDAIITAGSVSGHLTVAQRSQIDQAVGAEQLIYQNQVIPSFPASVADLYQGMLSSATWQQKTQVEQSLADAPVSSSGVITVPTAVGQQWQQVMSSLNPELQHLAQVGTGYILATANSKVSSFETHLIVQTALGAAAVVLVIVFTWWLIIVLRRRIFALRLAAEELETRLPDVVERLRSGEAVDTDTELPELHYGRDELGMLGRALNAARASALETSVRQVEQYRGFERLLQRIARRTQLLIGLQMKRLSEMERQYEDAAVLEGLFDLDHLAARLRRYEENLVILGGGQTQRRWRKPVPLLNVLRSAQGEVQDYRRIRIQTESRVWISERAVGALVHVLAELMENAVTFSKPPAPVEVIAAPVARGLAIEIEDRGMGLDAEQYAEANALMANPPRMDVLSRADDARLGLYVVARLAAKLDVKVELRPSSFGGTRVVVLVPAELVLAEHQIPASAESGEDDLELAPRLSVVGAVPDSAVPSNGTSASTLNGILNGSAGSVGAPDQSDPLLVGVGGGRSPDPAAAPSLEPLPRRVRQVSLVAELRETRDGGRDAGPHDDPEADAQESDPGRSGATVGAFQRQSRRARLAADGEPPLIRPSSDAEQTREEDGR
ncbi:nitrate- and nitrite sensing domain-containing protein [Actinospica sp.]|jgi:anti-sigma regulatory factor (Ser/Thr protein kinase)|uniref:sensor histidine kinase n=1 Tax=Actinospica sp. TaxID=1872142 RepID=UPI002D0A4D53|nr:nitrate- and nitrite sensing domain-containing protein [Actinospica sp.]HWG24226.1 nitrate- and nitrite sensing domain-containing protein [Actinospica sp.]